MAPLVLSGCGGGGSSDPAPAPPTPAPATLPPSPPAPPSISRQPADTSAIAGASVAFTVGLTNESGASYQWLRNGVEIAGAVQSSLRLASASLLDSGATFSVRVANAAGSAISQGARLTVASPAFTLIAGAAGSAGAGITTVDGVGSNARFFITSPLAVDKEGNIYVGAPAAIRKVTPAGVVTSFVGQYGQNERRDGTGSDARINGALALVFDPVRNVLVFLDAYGQTNGLTCDPDPAFALLCPTPAVVREITLAGTVTTRQPVAGVAVIAGLSIAPDASVYTAGGNSADRDAPALNYIPRAATALYRTLASGGKVLVAGNPDVRGYNDGSAGAALFYRITGTAADAKGNLYIVDGKRLRRLSADGVVTTLAGDPAVVGPADGQGAAAGFSLINAIAVDAAGNVVVVDSDLIRRITPEGNVSTVAQVTPVDHVMLQAMAIGSTGAVYVSGSSYVGRFEPIPG